MDYDMAMKIFEVLTNEGPMEDGDLTQRVATKYQINHQEVAQALPSIMERASNSGVVLGSVVCRYTFVGGEKDKEDIRKRAAPFRSQTQFSEEVLKQLNNEARKGKAIKKGGKDGKDEKGGKGKKGGK